MTSVWERAADLYAGKRRTFATPGELARRIAPTTVQTQALDLIDAALVACADAEDGRLIITMPPQEGKSTRVAKDFVIWKLLEDPNCRVITASYGQSLANRNGRAIRNAINGHPELGINIAKDNGSVSEWQLAGYDGGVLSVGIGAGVTGRPADLMVIDDPIKDRKEADSSTYRTNVWDWWTDSASTRLAPGASVVVILTRWHEGDLAGMLLEADDSEEWTVLNIPAQADHDPMKGEVDVLGRQPGEFMASARRRTAKQWEKIKRSKPARTWSALFQGHPSPVEGGIFQREWFTDQFYTSPPWFERDDGSCVVAGADDILISWDMTFKDTDGTDYVAGGVWARWGADAFLLDRVKRRMDFPASRHAVVALRAKWPQAVLTIIEDKANGPAVIASLRHVVPGLVAEEPQGSKEARAHAVAPLAESRNVHLPDPSIAPWVDEYLTELCTFPTAAHDDEVDQTSQALNRLVLQPLLAGGIVTAEDFEEELRDFQISPY
jgi:predicted phage terminase large subunit-like protein